MGNLDALNREYSHGLIHSEYFFKIVPSTCFVHHLMRKSNLHFMDILWLSVCSKSLIYALFFFWRLTGRKWPQHSHELTPTGAINANIYAIELIYAVWKNPLRAICYDIWILTGNINHHVLGKMHIYWMSAINLNKYKMTGLYKLVWRFWIWKQKHSSLKVWLGGTLKQYEMERKGR